MREIYYSSNPFPLCRVLPLYVLRLPCGIVTYPVTAAGRHQLKTMSLAKLKKYINSYNITIDRAVEKDDLIDAIISAKVCPTFSFFLDRIS